MHLVETEFIFPVFVWNKHGVLNLNKYVYLEFSNIPPTSNKARAKQRFDNQIHTVG